MATYGVAKLSGSTDGKPIAVSATTSGGANTIHTAVTGTTNFDLIELKCYNRDVDNETRYLSLSIGDTSTPAVIAIPAGTGPAYLGRWFLQNGAVISAWADEASDCYIDGIVMTVR